MKYYGVIGTNRQTIIESDNYTPAENEVLMQSERPTHEYIAQADGTWILSKQIKASNVRVGLQKKYSQELLKVFAGGNLADLQTAYQAELAEVADDVAYYMSECFPDWSGDGVEYKRDARVVYNGVLYKVLQDHTSQTTWTPTDAPSLFVKVLVSTSGGLLPWEQPDSTNGYAKGDRVMYNGKTYESLIDNNVWSPDAYPAGWQEVEE